jgi:TadE-like protein
VTGDKVTTNTHRKRNYSVTSSPCHLVTLSPCHITRRGTVALELLLALPVLLGVVLGVVEFGLMLVAEQQLVAASREGARVASQGGAQSDVVQAVEQFLGSGTLRNAMINAVLTDNMGQPLASGQPVTVTVSIPAKQVVPDLLKFVGFSIAGENLVGQTTMRKE